MAMPESLMISELTWSEIDEALKERPVALLPVGATEAHGPHLPVSTDTVLAIEMARRGARKLKERGVAALILPPVTFGASDLGADFPGTLNVSAETAAALVRDICVAALRKFRAVALVNLNFSPQQLECLRTAVGEAKKAGANVCLTDLTKKRWSDMLGEAFAAGDHAGAFETSLMMAAAPESVRDARRRSLPPLDGWQSALKKGAKTFLEAGSEDAYFGDPTAATAEDGESHWESLVEILAITVMEHLGSKA